MWSQGRMVAWRQAASISPTCTGNMQWWIVPHLPPQQRDKRERPCRSRARRWPGQRSIEGASIWSAAMPSNGSIGPTITPMIRPQTWETLTELPRGANHVGMTTPGDQLYAFGGFTEQNRMPHDGAFAFDGARWHSLRRLPEACGAIARVTLGDAIIANVDGHDRSPAPPPYNSEFVSRQPSRLASSGASVVLLTDIWLVYVWDDYPTRLLARRADVRKD